MQRTRLAKILAPTVKLELKVEGVPTLKLQLAWTMRAVIVIESDLRKRGIEINALQNPSKFWLDLDCTMLALGVWAASLQEHPEYDDDEGYDVIASYIVPENYGTAAKALKECFLESLSDERRREIKEAEAKAERIISEGIKSAEEIPDPTPAPTQS